MVVTPRSGRLELAQHTTPRKMHTRMTPLAAVTELEEKRRLNIYVTEEQNQRTCGNKGINAECEIIYLVT